VKEMVSHRKYMEHHQNINDIAADGTRHIEELGKLKDRRK
jgi:hypothetical protein